MSSMSFHTHKYIKKNLKLPLPKDDLLKSTKARGSGEDLRRKFLNVVNVNIPIFCIISLWKRAWPFIPLFKETLILPFTQELFVPTLLKLAQWSCSRRFLNDSNNFLLLHKLGKSTEAHLRPIKLFFGIRYNEFLNSL